MIFFSLFIFSNITIYSTPVAPTQPQHLVFLSKALSNTRLGIDHCTILQQDLFTSGLISFINGPAFVYLATILEINPMMKSNGKPLPGRKKALSFMSELAQKGSKKHKILKYTINFLWSHRGDQLIICLVRGNFTVSVDFFKTGPILENVEIIKFDEDQGVTIPSPNIDNLPSPGTIVSPMPRADNAKLWTIDFLEAGTKAASFDLLKKWIKINISRPSQNELIRDFVLISDDKVLLDRSFVDLVLISTAISSRIYMIRFMLKEKKDLLKTTLQQERAAAYRILSSNPLAKRFKLNPQRPEQLGSRLFKMIQDSTRDYTP